MKFKNKKKAQKSLSWWRICLEYHNKRIDEMINNLESTKDLMEALVIENERLEKEAHEISK